MEDGGQLGWKEWRLDEEEDDGNGAAFDAISDVISIFGHDASMNVGFS